MAFLKFPIWFLTQLQCENLTISMPLRFFVNSITMDDLEYKIRHLEKMLVIDIFHSEKLIWRKICNLHDRKILKFAHCDSYNFRSFYFEEFLLIADLTYSPFKTPQILPRSKVDDNWINTLNLQMSKMHLIFFFVKLTETKNET